VKLEARAQERLTALIAKAGEVLRTHKPNPKMIGFATLDFGPYSEWRTQSLTFLSSLLGADALYAINFDEVTGGDNQGQTHALHSGRGILRAVLEDVRGGYLFDVRRTVEAEVFSDFLEMAEHLLAAGYSHAAGSLCGAVLEDGLRRIADANGVAYNKRDGLSLLNDKCAKTGVYNALTQKQVRVWIEVRNNADHGNFNEYTEADVRNMLQGVTNFLAQYS
jgi:hypothetical protein